MLRVRGQPEVGTLSRSLRSVLGQAVSLTWPSEGALAIWEQSRRDIVLSVIIIAAALSFAWSVLLNSAHNVLRRRAAEIAVWRALGMGRTGVRAHLLRESLAAPAAAGMSATVLVAGVLLVQGNTKLLPYALLISVSLSLLVIAVGAVTATRMVERWMRLEPAALLKGDE